MKLHLESPSFTRVLSEALALWLEGQPQISKAFSDTKATTIFADFGQDDARVMQAYSFVFLPDETYPKWATAIKEFREKEGLKEENFEFKKLTKDRKRKRLLPDFLAICGTLEGFTMTLLVPPDIKWAFPSQSGKGDVILKNAFGLELHPNIAEKTLRIVHGALGGLSALPQIGKSVFFFADRDAAMINIEKVAQLFSSILTSYLKSSVKEIVVGYDDGIKGQTGADLISIADLVCGTVTEIHNRTNGNPHIPSPKTNQILSWMHDESQILKHVVLKLNYETVEGVQWECWHPIKYQAAKPPSQE